MARMALNTHLPTPSPECWDARSAPCGRRTSCVLGKPSKRYPLPLCPYSTHTGLASWLLPLALVLYAFSTCLFLSLILLYIFRLQSPMRHVVPAAFPTWSLMVDPKFIFHRLLLLYNSHRPGLRKWFLVILCQVPRGSIGSSLSSMLKCIVSLRLEKTTQSVFASRRLFSSSILLPLHQEVELLPSFSIWSCLGLLGAMTCSRSGVVRLPRLAS